MHDAIIILSPASNILHPPPPLHAGVPYRYTGDLLWLQVATASQGRVDPPALARISSHLLPCLMAWRSGLSDHPNREFVNYVMEGLTVGIRVGFNYTTPLHSARHNTPSMAEHPEVINKYMEGERASGRILVPFEKGTVINIQVNRLGVVPKGHTPGKWRLITDLSHPEGASVNDGIDGRLCSLQYTSVNVVARAVQTLGA